MTPLLPQSLASGLFSGASATFPLEGGIACVFIVPWMAVLAVSAGLSRVSARDNARFQAGFKNVASEVQNLGKRFVALCYARLDRISLQSAAAPQLREEVRLSLDFVFDRYASVVLALAVRGPAAILRTVTAIVVDAVKYKSLWSVAHVGHKIGEVVPARINRNSPTSVVFPSGCFRIAASIAHGLPYGIERMRIFERHGLPPLLSPYHIMGG